MIAFQRPCCLLLAAATLLQSFTAGAYGGDLFGIFKGKKPPTHRSPSVETLAEEIDWLEHHIDHYGSVVAKQPDIWGQARLTKHRHEFEKQMATRLNQFQATLQGSLSRSDQAYLAQAMSMSAAISGAPPVYLAPETPATTTTTGAITVPTPSDAEKLVTNVANSTTVIHRNDATLMAPLGFDPQKISIEPTLYLDQMARYLDHLNQIRRQNEGDDTADSPGYSLNLVRIPISILPGKHTRIGYGAEITITAEPYLSDELLPTTFRNLVVNDLVDQLAFPLTKILDDKGRSTGDLLSDLASWRKKNTELAQTNQPLLSFADFRTPAAPAPNESIVHEHALSRLPKHERAIIKSYNDRYWSKVAAGIASDDLHPQALQAISSETDDAERKLAKAQELFAQKKVAVADEMLDETARQYRANALAAVQAQLANAQPPVPSVPASPSRRARLPFPPTQLFDVYGLDLLAYIVLDARSGLRNDPINRRVTHYMDVQGFLKEELSAAYEMLSTEQFVASWEMTGQALAVAVRTRNVETISRIRASFMKFAGREVGNWGETIHSNTTIALAWAILVESALLNERLVQDMHETATSKGCGCLNGEQWMPFYLPRPAPEARQAFNEYVRCRWPIHVFALDPANEDQNIADTFARRRETQLALSLAFASGNIGARSFTNYSRRLEWNYETIAINRTIVGFSHGDDTFGWRFFPRFQTPDIESNTTVLFRDLIVGGPNRDAELRQRRIEPGIRECVAIIMMPSFVPYVTFDTRANWFCLTHPAKTELTMHDTMKLSRSIQSMHEFAGCVNDRGLYRDGEVPRLLRRVHQLDRELPLQTMVSQMPFEQTLGGFEMFSTGVRDLAPELIGFYGEPGINPDKETTIFLVGNGFSVHETRVIVGNKEINAYYPFDDNDPRTAPKFASEIAGLKQPVPGRMLLLSRQIMQVVIPPGAVPIDGLVDVHVATPYGVSNHLLVPAVQPPAPPPTSNLDGPLVADIAFDLGNVCRCQFENPVEDKLALPADVTGVVPNVDLILEINGIPAAGKPVALGVLPPLQLTYVATKKVWTAPLKDPQPQESCSAAQSPGSLATIEGLLRQLICSTVSKNQALTGLTATAYILLRGETNPANAQWRIADALQVTLKSVDVPPKCERLPCVTGTVAAPLAPFADDLNGQQAEELQGAPPMPLPEQAPVGPPHPANEGQQMRYVPSRGYPQRAVLRMPVRAGR